MYAHCATLFENQRRQFPDAHRLVTLGVGLDGVAVPTVDSFRLRPHDDEVEFVVLDEQARSHRSVAQEGSALVGQP